MPAFTAADVKRLRDATGAGMMDAKKALTEADGEYDKAIERLRPTGGKDAGTPRGPAGADRSDARKALPGAGGEYDKAIELLRIKAARAGGKRLERSTTNG